MHDVIPMHQAKTTLSQLVRRAVAGETILIGPDGEAAVQLVALGSGSDHPKRKLGGLKRRVRIARDFDAPMPDIEDLFEGNSR